MAEIVGLLILTLLFVLGGKRILKEKEYLKKITGLNKLEE
jgi:hypothetical protein